VRAKLPGCRYPGVAARRAQGGADAQVQPQLKLNRGDPIHYEFTLVKRSEAAAAVQPGPAVPFRLIALVVSALNTPGPVGLAGAAASFRLRIAGPAGPFVLAWTGDRSPIRGCTTTGRVQVLGHVNTP